MHSKRQDPCILFFPGILLEVIPSPACCVSRARVVFSNPSPHSPDASLPSPGIRPDFKAYLNARMPYVLEWSGMRFNEDGDTL